MSFFSTSGNESQIVVVTADIKPTCYIIIMILVKNYYDDHNFHDYHGDHNYHDYHSDHNYHDGREKLS